LVGSMFPFIALDILSHVAEKDREYFRASREKRVGVTLEDFVANREAKLAAFRASLAPMRSTLKAQPFFGGSQPLYADYALFGPFQWARCVSPFALLEASDPVRLWRDRLLDRFGGLARAAPAYDA
jgi:glutathione S-transferase